MIDRAKQASDINTIEEKYGYTYDQIVSATAGKTLILVELLNACQTTSLYAEPAARAFESRPSGTATVKRSASGFDFFGINKWLVIVALVCITMSVGVYMWADNNSSEDTSMVVAAPISVDDSDAKRYLKGFRTTDETLYAIAQPEFEALGQDEQKQVLQKMLKFAYGRNLKYVNIMNPKGHSLAFASADRLDTASVR